MRTSLTSPPVFGTSQKGNVDSLPRRATLGSASKPSPATRRASSVPAATSDVFSPDAGASARAGSRVEPGANPSQLQSGTVSRLGRALSERREREGPFQSPTRTTADSARTPSSGHPPHWVRVGGGFASPETTTRRLCVDHGAHWPSGSVTAMPAATFDDDESENGLVLRAPPAARRESSGAVGRSLGDLFGVEHHGLGADLGLLDTFAAPEPTPPRSVRRVRRSKATRPAEAAATGPLLAATTPVVPAPVIPEVLEVHSVDSGALRVEPEAPLSSDAMEMGLVAPDAGAAETVAAPSSSSSSSSSTDVHSAPLEVVRRESASSLMPVFDVVAASENEASSDSESAIAAPFAAVTNVQPTSPRCFEGANRPRRRSQSTNFTSSHSSSSSPSPTSSPRPPSSPIIPANRDTAATETWRPALPRAEASSSGSVALAAATSAAASAAGPFAGSIALQSPPRLVRVSAPATRWTHGDDSVSARIVAVVERGSFWDPHTAYCIRTSYLDDFTNEPRTATVERRFTDFAQLHDVLGVLVRRVPLRTPLPPKHLFARRAAVVEERRLLFQRLLDELVQDRRMARVRVVWHFLTDPDFCSE